MRFNLPEVLSTFTLDNKQKIENKNQTMLDYKVVLSMLLLAFCMISHSTGIRSIIELVLFSLSLSWFIIFDIFSPHLALPLTTSPNHEDNISLLSTDTDDPNKLPGQSLQLPSPAPIFAAAVAFIPVPVLFVSVVIAMFYKSR
jgi:hypothetical protein